MQQWFLEVAWPTIASFFRTMLTDYAGAFYPLMITVVKVFLVIWIIGVIFYLIASVVDIVRVLVSRAGARDLLLHVDRLTTFTGHVFAWSVVILTVAVVTEVLSRYVLKQPSTWGYDWSLIFYGALFMMAGPYALARNAHVRGDFLYRNWRPRTQAAVDLILYFLFFFPGILALIYSGWNYFQFSYLINERSAFSPEGPVIWPFKALIPITGVLMLLQGIVEVIRCIVCLRTGVWPNRLHDVEEMEKIILEKAEQGDITPQEVFSTTRGSL